MSSDINQSLDAIIKSSKSAGSKSSGGTSTRTRRTRRGGSKTGAGVSKAAGAAAVGKTTKAGGKKATGAKGSDAALAAIASSMLTNSKRVLLSGMPHDIDEKQVREFLSGHLGAVSKIITNFNANGKPTGSFTITFKKEGSALQMFQKFDGAPIDGGRQKMAVQILVDGSTTSSSSKSLADRLSLPAAEKGTSKNVKAAKTAKASDSKGSKAVKTDNASGRRRGGRNGKTRAGKGRDNTRRTKTAEELDAEMADYFAAPATGDASNNEISV